MQLTAAEQTFFLRMASHVERGLDFTAAGEAVLADDSRLVDAALATDGVNALHGYTFVKATQSSAAARGRMIRSGLSGAVYQRLRAN